MCVLGWVRPARPVVYLRTIFVTTLGKNSSSSRTISPIPYATGTCRASGPDLKKNGNTRNSSKFWSGVELDKKFQLLCISPTYGYHLFVIGMQIVATQSAAKLVKTTSLPLRRSSQASFHEC